MTLTQSGLNRHKLRKIIIAVYSAAIAICIAVVMFFLYDPNQNNLGALSSVCMDIICIIILMILIGDFVFDNFALYRTTRLFAGLLIATIWALFLDFLNWAFDGSLVFGQLTYWFTVGSLCMGAVLAGFFSWYLYGYMEETHKLRQMRSSAFICVIMNLVSFVLTFALAITGTAFSFVDGHYETGAFYDIVTVIPIVSLLYLTCFVIRYTKTVGMHDVYAVAGYILFMIAGALIEASYSIGTTYVSVAIADIFIFVMMQNAIIAREKRNVQEWMLKSNTDALTGLYNRHAYENDLKELEKSIPETNFVYVSVDVNSLKETNDSSGHSAGDELLMGAAECLRKCLGEYGKLYRTGGDEFVALINIDEDKLSQIKTNIDEATEGWYGKQVDRLSLSCGFVLHAEDENMSVRHMAVLADQRMYEAKAEYYRSNGIERRKIQ